MSYILKALRKSETERKQGQIPDLGSSVQIIHKPRKYGPSLLLWGVVLALLVNAGVLAWLFWPGGDVFASVAGRSQGRGPMAESAAPVAPQSAGATVSEAGPVVPEANQAQAAPDTLPATPDTGGSDTLIAPRKTVMPESKMPPESAVASAPSLTTAPPPAKGQGGEAVIDVSLSVPTLGDMSASFQRRVPDLMFNSHIFSSSPEARRIMINDEYLREGARFRGMVVEEITEDGVILSLQGESFSVSVVRDWTAPR
jgi:general secretion pathway protein B